MAFAGRSHLTGSDEVAWRFRVAAPRRQEARLVQPVLTRREKLATVGQIHLYFCA